MNSRERAVIEAARAWRHGHIRTIAAAQPIERALDALEELELAQAAAGTAEIDWTLIVAGDEIRGKSGAFFPVLGTQQIGGQVKVRIGLPGGPRTITRPHPDEPFATVKRGPDGKAVDEFVNVFSSGEK